MVPVFNSPDAISAHYAPDSIKMLAVFLAIADESMRASRFGGQLVDRKVARRFFNALAYRGRRAGHPCGLKAVPIHSGVEGVEGGGGPGSPPSAPGSGCGDIGE